MTAQNSAGPGHHPGTGATNHVQATKPTGERTADDRLPVVTAIAVPPMGRRALWMLWVAQCPRCGTAHLHRAGTPTGGVRAAGCGVGSYHVRVARAQGREVA